MCRMVALSGEISKTEQILERFYGLSETGNVLPDMTKGHNDGWGIAGYLSNWAVHFGRSEKNALEEKDRFIEAYSKAINSGSRIMIAHIRKASKGQVELSNTHPFISGDWIFAHNGDVHNAESLMIDRYDYEGSTDSEKWYKFLLFRLFHKPFSMYPEIIRSAVKEVKALCKTSSLTFVITNGDHIIGYRDYSEDENYYTLHYSVENDTSVICSEPLDGLKWKTMKNGEIFIADKFGRKVYPID